jgi:3',5'-cyclic AMP phosphodiesterase CpdA
MQANSMDAIQPMPRRDALKHLSAGALLAAGLWPGSLRAAKRGHDTRFRFIAVNDTHLMTPECGEWLAGAVRQMKAEEPEFCLHCGDLTETGERENLEAVKDVFEELDQPMYPVIGNHDYLTPDDFEAYRRTFRQRFNYSFRHRGWQFIGLDSSEGQKYENTRIQETTFQWLAESLRRLDKRQPTVLFTHFPLGLGVKYRPLNADALLERFLDFNLQAVFCGHFHGFTERTAGEVTLTTNRCCALKRANHDGTTEKGYFVCDVSNGKVTRRFVQYDGRPTRSGSNPKTPA